MGPARDYPKLLAVAGTALLAGWMCRSVNIPAAWLIGALVAGIGWGAFGSAAVRVPAGVHRLAVAVIGANIAANVSLDEIQTIRSVLAPALLSIFLLIGLTIALGFVFSRRAGVNAATGILSFVPGGAAAAVAVSGELEADTRLVSTLQYLRVLLVVLLVPPVAALVAAGAEGQQVSVGPPVSAGSHVSAGSPAAGPVGVEAPTVAEDLSLEHRPGQSLRSRTARAALVTWASIVGGFVLALVFRFPAAPLLTPLALLMFAVLAGLPYIPIPSWAENGSLLVLGMYAGVQFDRAALRSAGKRALWSLPLLLGIVAVSTAMAAFLSRTTNVDFTTAFLAMIPGGLETMTATSLDLGADVTVVTSVQLLRLFLVLVLSPIIIRYVHRSIRKRRPGVDAESL